MQTVAVVRPTQQTLNVLELWQAQRIETAEAENVWTTAIARAQWNQDFTPRKAQIGSGLAVYGGRYTHLTQGLAYGHRVDQTAVRKNTQFFQGLSEWPRVRLASLWTNTLGCFEGAGYQPISDALVMVREVEREVSGADQESTVFVSTGGEQADTNWIRSSTQGFCDRDDIHPCELQIGAALALNSEALLFSACSAGGDICATSSLRVWNGVGLLFGDSTRRDWRGLGLQSAMISARLQHAAALGCDLAVAEVAERSGSARNYERAGFRPLYRRITLALDC